MAYKGNQFRVEATAGLYSLDNSLKACSIRFTAETTKTVTGLRIYIHTKTGTSPTYRVGLQANVAGVPSETWLGGSNNYATIQFTATGWASVSLPASVNLTAGTVYHIVIMYHSGTINTSNYVSLRKTTPQSLFHTIDSSADSNAACTYYDNLELEWFEDASNGPHVLVYSDSTYGGNPYETFSTQAITTTYRHREKWVISGGSINIATIGAVVKKNISANPADDLYYEICDSEMNVLRSGTLVTKTIVTISYAWYDAILSSSLNLVDGSTYYFVLKSPDCTGNYYQIARLETTDSSVYYGLSLNGNTSIAGYSSNSGSNWTDYNYADLTFRCTLTTFVSISGYVKDEDTQAVENVTITYTGNGGGSTPTNSSGFYTLTLATGYNYTVTPSLNDWNFTPTSRTYNNLQADQTNQDYAMGPTSVWADSSFVKRKRIKFGTDHDVVPSGYTFKLPLSMGYHKKIATNGCYNQSIQQSAANSMAAQSNNDLWVTYLSKAGDSGNYEIWIVKYTNSTQSWGTPYKICNAPTTYDTHEYPNIIADSNNILHLVYSIHNSYLYYRKSTSTNPTSASGWSSASTLSNMCTYPRIRVDSQNRIYVFFRGTTYGKSGYVRYNGSSWESYVNLVNLTTIPGPACYINGVMIKNNIIHYAFTPLQYYMGANQARGVGYLKGTINAETGNIVWTKVDGTSITLPVDYVTDDSILYPVISTSAPWYGSNSEALAVNNSGVAYFAYHGWNTYNWEEVFVWVAHWNGSSWTKENISESITPNRKAWGGRSEGFMSINPTNDNIFVFAIIKPPIHEGTAQGGATTYIDLATTADGNNDYYNGNHLRIKAGTGSGQKKRANDYVGSSKRVTPDTNFSPAPDNTSEYVASKKWFGGELGVWKYNGSSWSFEFLTMNSMDGIGMINGKPNFNNNTYAIVWARGWDIYFTECGQIGGMRPDGEDIRIYYKGSEIDRVAEHFNAEGNLYFKCQTQVTANKNFDQQGNYYVYYSKADPGLPKGDPEQVHIEYHSFELFADGESIKDKEGWTGSTGIGPHVYNSTYQGTDKIVAGDKSLVFDLADYVKKTIGTDLQSYEIIVYFVAVVGDYNYLSLEDITAGKEFRVGRTSNDKWAYYDATGWHETAYSCMFSQTHQLKIVINSSGCTAYGDGQVLTSNNNHITVFDNLILGNIGTTVSYFDQIIIVKWLSNPPEPTAGEEEFVGGGTIYYRTSNLNLGISTSEEHPVSFVRESNVNSGIGTEIEKAFTTSRTIDSSIGLSSAEEHPVSFVRESNVNSGIGTGIEILIDYIRNLQSDMGLSSQYSQIGTFIRNMENGVGLSSSVDTSFLKIVELLSNVGIITDISVLFLVIRDCQSDIGISSQLAEVGTFLRNLSDSISLNSNLQKETAFLRTSQSNIGLTTGTETILSKIIELVNDIGLTTTISEVVAFVREGQSNVGLSDQLIKEGTFLRDLQDNIGLTSIFQKEGLFYRDLENGVGLTSAVDIFVGKVIELFSNLGLATTLGLIGTYIRDKESGIGLTSQVEKIGTFYKTLTSDIGITSQVLAQLLLIERNVYSSIGLTDQLEKIMSFVRDLSENAGIVSSLAKEGTFLRDVQETINLTDLIETFKFFNRATADNMGMFSALQKLLTAQKNLQDNLGLTSSLSKVGTYSRELQDQINLTSLANRIFIFYRFLTDDLGLSDQIATIITYEVVRFGEKIFTESGKRILSQSLTSLLTTDQIKKILTMSQTIKLMTEHYFGHHIIPPGGESDEGTKLATRGKIGDGTDVATGGKVSD